MIVLTGSVFAWSGKADVSGKPDDFSSRSRAGYYIWQDDDGFHIWTTARGAEHVFSGVIRTDGNLFNVRGHRLEGGDSFKKYDDIREKSWFDDRNKSKGKGFSAFGRHVDYDKDQIRFKFETTSGSEGLNFRINNADYIEFDLYIDGYPINRKAIHIGENGWHPNSNKFRINN